jgi:hypothetical protein
MPFGSWPDLVNRGDVEDSLRVPVRRKGRKTASFLREGFSIPLIAAPARSTSPHLAKSQEVVAKCGPHAKAGACERGVAPAREAGTAAGARPRAGAWSLGHQQPEILVHIRRRFRAPHVGFIITARALQEEAEIGAE